MKVNFIPINCKVYPLNMQEKMALDEFLNENLHTGRIRPSKSPMASPFFEKKKGGPSDQSKTTES